MIVAWESILRHTTSKQRCTLSLINMWFSKRAIDISNEINAAIVITHTQTPISMYFRVYLSPHSRSALITETLLTHKSHNHVHMQCYHLASIVKCAVLTPADVMYADEDVLGLIIPKARFNNMTDGANVVGVLAYRGLYKFVDVLLMNMHMLTYIDHYKSAITQAYVGSKIRGDSYKWDLITLLDHNAIMCDASGICDVINGESSTWNNCNPVMRAAILVNNVEFAKWSVYQHKQHQMLETVCDYYAQGIVTLEMVSITATNREDIQKMLMWSRLPQEIREILSTKISI